MSNSYNIVRFYKAYCDDDETNIFFTEENQKRYAENDARIKESPLVKKLLEQSKLNKEK